MYVPTHFDADEAAVKELLANHGAGDLVTSTADGLLATMLPFVYDPDSHVLKGHLARNNEQWQRPVLGEAMVIIRGPDAYISPAWYQSKREHGRVVPTWNYITAHVYGRLTVHDDPAWVEALVRQLTAKHDRIWSVDDAPEKYVAGQLRAILGVELTISRIEAKFKLSQNRPAADVDGVIQGLTQRGDTESAEAVRTANHKTANHREPA